MTVTRNRFSCSSTIDPLMEPMAQHSRFSDDQLHSRPLSYNEAGWGAGGGWMGGVLCVSAREWGRSGTA